MNPPTTATLAEMRQRSRFFTLSLDLLCNADFDGVFKQLNPSWQRVLGYPVSELIGRPFLDFVHPEDREATVAETRRLVTGVETVSFENRFICRDGSLRWLLWCSSVSLEDRLFYATARDVTDLRRAREELTAAKEAAESANRAKSEFLAKMSHELRTPLNGVIGFGSVLSRNTAGNLGEKDLLFLGRIVENGKHLLGLIDELLDISRMENPASGPDPAPIPLALFVREILVDSEASLKAKRIRLTAELPENLQPIRIDAGRLRRVLTKLLDNAVKFTEEGRVTVRVTANAETGVPRDIAVIDTGIGIPKERQAVIFEAFEQADAGPARRYGGPGLGLARARHLCELIGCRLEVESEPGSGSTFRVVLPQPLGLP